MRFNDPAKPNCVGEYRAAELDPTTCQAGSDPLKPAWCGGDCTATTGSAACRPGESAASTTGHVLISELQQIYDPDMQNTLCVVLPGNDPATSKPRVAAEGFYDAATSSCASAKWNPSLPDGSGIPKGDWCAATNTRAHDKCHDAWRLRFFHVYAGAKIELDPTGAPATCSF